MNRLLYLLLLFPNSESRNNTAIEHLIYKGYNVGIHQYSYAVYLYLESTRPASCGASLIMVQAVLTAAHCVDTLKYKRGNIFAYFGATVPKDAYVVRKVMNYKINPKYNEVKGTSNLAVAFLEKRVPLRHETKKIPLVIKNPPVGTYVFSVGWGKQRLGGKLPDFSKFRTLKATKQKIMSGTECERYAGFKLSASTLCTLPVIGHHYKDDAGNGLIQREPSHLLIGVLSFISQDISVYSSVLAHRDWIIKTCRDLYVQSCLSGKG